MSIESMSATEAPGSRRAQAIVHVIESAVDVRRRYQFFVWTQSSFQHLLPHKVAICGVYERSRKQVRLEVFNSIVVPAPVLALLTDGQSPLMQQIVSAWINNHGRPLIVKLNALSGRLTAAAAEGLRDAGFTELLVHGVSRPQRASNVQGAFKAATERGADIAGRRVVLVDDVLTSGATTDACARALLRAKAAQVDVLVFARVVDTHRAPI